MGNSFSCAGEDQGQHFHQPASSNAAPYKPSSLPELPPAPAAVAVPGTGRDGDPAGPGPAQRNSSVGSSKHFAASLRKFCFPEQRPERPLCPSRLPPQSPTASGLPSLRSRARRRRGQPQRRLPQIPAGRPWFETPAKDAQAAVC